VQGDLVLEGQLTPPDPESHGIVASLSTAQATGGQGTSASYVVQLTNTRRDDDAFSLTVAGLPAGITAMFAESKIDVRPGAGNFRDVTMKLTVGQGTSPRDYPFSVTASSTSDPSVTTTTNGMLAAMAGGVTVLIQSLTDPGITTTAVATVATPSTPLVSRDGLEVTHVLRYGYHWMPTTIVVTFNQALDPASAEDARDNRIIAPGGRTIRVRRAVYDQATHSSPCTPSGASMSTTNTS
jgi:hypothetical protein